MIKNSTNVNPAAANRLPVGDMWGVRGRHVTSMPSTQPYKGRVGRMGSDLWSSESDLKNRIPKAKL